MFYFNLKIYLCAREKELFDAWKLFCVGSHSFVEPTMQNILDVPADAVVAPANSFGFMTGGIDLYYRNYFGKGIEIELQKRIKNEYDGELLVGQATSVKVSHPEFQMKYLIAAPTMRVPENVSHTINAYLAAKAALKEALRIGVTSVVFSGLGTGTGMMSSDDCAKQVNAAINDVVVMQGRFPTTIYEEQEYMRKHIVSQKWFKVQVMEEKV